MAPALFTVHEHKVPTSYIREYARGTADDQEAVLHLAVKQYTPLKTVPHGSRSITIIAAHANGFPKEMYEPLWDELAQRLAVNNVHIHGIWIADVSYQGESGVLNEELIGDDPSWMDHPRDLFLMINHFRSQMKRPLMGIGHSMGGNNIVNLSLMHPRLLSTVILIDPVIQRFNSSTGSFSLAKSSTRRRDQWPSREAARATFMKSPFYKGWDPRVMDNWVQYGLRDLPTHIYPEAANPAKPTAATTSNDRAVTLTTTKHQEVFSFLRANFPTKEYPDPTTLVDPTTHADVDSRTLPNTPFYRPEPLATFHKLPFLRPSVLYLFGDQSPLSKPLLIADKLANTGIGIGGSGGVKKDRVKQVTFAGIGHMIPMEAVHDSADASAAWIVSELERWHKIEEKDRQEQDKVPRHLRSQMRPEYVETMLSDWDRPTEKPKL